MKRILLLLFGVLMTLPTFARDFTYEYEGQTLTYTVIDEDAKTCMTKEGYVDVNDSAKPGNSITGSLVIPSVAKDGETEYTVTSIGNLAFIGCGKLESIALPESLYYIGNSAFCACKSLKSIEIPELITSIGDYAFSGCQSLKSVEIPELITSIGDYAFSGCQSLESIKLPESLTSIGDYVFHNCKRLKSIILPKSLISIGVLAFGLCSELESIEFPKSLTSIGNYAFSQCIKLDFIEFPESISSIGTEAFNNCKGLTSIKLPESLSTIGTSAFMGTSLSDIYYNTIRPILISKSVFKELTYYYATLHVPESAIDTFRETPCWNYFRNINGYNFNGVEEISADFDSTLPYDVFRISGEYVGNNTEGLTPGIYILRQGTTVKKITVM